MASVSSMTGFAAASRPTPLGLLSIELRSVNSRFLDIGMRIADELRALEAPLRDAIGARLARGKIECRVWLQRP
ncbi:MAG TPA: YicC/YloC family endoribonuclease, partial [Burkholderiaceae bacterium]|nr:YicC/YloC family endoribonuclease [Burkholderiaceae bacterium]